MPDWADERAREIVDDIYFAATRAWSQTPQQAWDSQPHKAQIAAALRAEREKRVVDALPKLEAAGWQDAVKSRELWQAERERGQKLAGAVGLAEYRADSHNHTAPIDLVTCTRCILREALAAWQEAVEVKHSTTNTDWTRQKDDDEPVDIVSAGADLEARRQRLQYDPFAFTNTPPTFAKHDFPGHQHTSSEACWAALATHWQARALKAEAAVLKARKVTPCVFCNAEWGHAPDCLRAELEARK